MPAYFGEAFLLGLATGPICLAYCAPILAPLVVAEEKNKFRPLAILLGLFLLGRLAGYLAVGLIVGITSVAAFKAAGPGLAAVVTILMGGALLIFGLFKNFPHSKLCQLAPRGGSARVWALTLGLLTGVNLCPPFLAAITGAATLGALRGSMFYFLAFYLGTALYVPPMAILSPLAKIQALNQVAKICLFLGGVWFLFKGTMMLMSGN